MYNIAPAMIVEKNTVHRLLRYNCMVSMRTFMVMLDDGAFFNCRCNCPRLPIRICRRRENAMAVTHAVMHLAASSFVVFFPDIFRFLDCLGQLHIQVISDA